MDERTKQLVDLLVGEEHRRLFQTDAPFYASVVMLAQLYLPAFVAGLAARATERQQRIDEELRRAFGGQV